MKEYKFRDQAIICEGYIRSTAMYDSKTQNITKRDKLVTLKNLKSYVGEDHRYNIQELSQK